METIIQPKPIELNTNSVAHLAETRKWTMFISIIGFILLGLCVIILLYLLVSAGSYRFGRHGLFTTIPILLLTALYFFPVYYLINFSINSKKAIINSDSQFLENALRYLKYHYRFMGILIIVILGIYLVAGLAALLSYMGR